MTQMLTQAKPPGVKPRFPGIAAANARARRLERQVALVVVITPLLGLIAALALLWGHALDAVQLGILAGMYFITAIGIGIGYHRLVSHGSFQTTPWLRGLFAVFGSMAGQGPILYWAAIHRRHHATSDRPGDPHSPHLHEPGFANWLGGFWHAHTGWLFHHEITDWSRYITDLIRDPVLYRVNRLYPLWMVLGLAIPAVLGGVLTWTWMGALLGFLWGGLVRMFLTHHSTWSINSICHLFGSTPFRAPDQSRNNFWVALPTLGEGWHNNHHAFPYSAYHGLRWYQVDVNAWIIRSLKLVGLAWSVKVPSDHLMQEARTDVVNPQLN